MPDKSHPAGAHRAVIHFQGIEYVSYDGSDPKTHIGFCGIGSAVNNSRVTDYYAM